MLWTASLCVAAGPAQAASDTHLEVTVNGEPVDVEATLDSEGFDVTNGNYTICDTNGNSRTVTVNGWSIKRLLDAAGVTAGEVSSVSVPRIASSGDVVLHPGDYDTTSFPEGPALIESRTSMGNVSTADDFLRPYRGSGCASDPNADDYVITPVDTALTVQIASGTQLQVSDTVDHSSVTAGQDATFTAQVANPPSGTTLNYRWVFGDGTIGSGQSVAHAFTSTGSYTVQLTVDSGASAGGAATPLAVTVGSAAGPAGAGKTPTPRATKPGTTAKPAPTTRPVTAASRTPAPASSRAAPPVAVVAPPPAATSPAATLPPPGTGAPASAAPAPVLASTRSVPPSAPPAPVGEFVAGRAITLLAPAAAQPVASPTSAVAELQQALGPHGTTATTSHDWAPAAGVGAVLLLGAVGAGTELVSARRVKR